MSTIGKKILSILNSTSKSATNRGALKPFEEATSIGILYTWEGAKKEELVYNLIDKLGTDKSVRGLCYNPNKNEEVETKTPLMSVGDLSLLGKINSSAADSFLSESFDYLFHLDFEVNEITAALLLKSQAQCRVGLHSDKAESLFELMIGINKSAGLEHLIEQMLKYVNALK